MIDYKYSYLSDIEFLRQMASKRDVSPIIDVLCNRLEKSLDSEIDECPICECKLENYYSND